MRKMSSQPFSKYKVVLALLNITKGWERYLRIFENFHIWHQEPRSIKCLPSLFNPGFYLEECWWSFPSATSRLYPNIPKRMKKAQFCRIHRSELILEPSKIPCPVARAEDAYQLTHCRHLQILSKVDNLEEGETNATHTIAFTGSRFPSNGCSSNTLSLCSIGNQIWSEK